MQEPVVIIGIGEIGGVFARALLRQGRPIYPVTRALRAVDVAARIPAPQLVLVAVGEADLTAALSGLPDAWRDRVALVQNELLPTDWAPYGLSGPTVASIWFEKKPGQDVKVVLPTPVFGPGAGLLQGALETLAIPCVTVRSEGEMLFQLVLKNLYILVTNVCGLETGGTVGGLWSAHRGLASEVAAEVIDLQEALAGARFDRDRLIAAMVAAFNGDPDHRCTGRSAPQRLERALERARQHGLALPALRRIGERAGAAANGGPAQTAVCGSRAPPG